MKEMVKTVTMKTVLAKIVGDSDGEDVGDRDNEDLGVGVGEDGDEEEVGDGDGEDGDED